MNVAFKVHNVSETNVTIPVTINDEQVRASVPCLEVELVTLGRSALTLRFVGGSIDEARDLFERDQVVTASFGANGEAEAA